LPPDSHITIASGIAQSPNQLATVCWACAAETCWARCTSSSQAATWDLRPDSAAACSARACSSCAAAAGAAAGDLSASGVDPLIEGDDLGASLLHLGELCGDQVAKLPHARGKLCVGLLDPAEELSASGQVVEALGVEQHLGRVRSTAHVDGHEAARERAQGAAQAGPSLGEPRRRLVHTNRELGLALPALGEDGGELRLSRGGDRRLGASRGQL
jgi:hypothetical protein